MEGLYCTYFTKSQQKLCICHIYLYSVTASSAVVSFGSQRTYPRGGGHSAYVHMGVSLRKFHLIFKYQFRSIAPQKYQLMILVQTKKMLKQCKEVRVASNNGSQTYMCLYHAFFCLPWLWQPRLCRETELGHCRLE